MSTEHVGTTKYVCPKCGWWVRQYAPTGPGADRISYGDTIWHDPFLNADGSTACEGGPMHEVIEEAES